MLKRYAAAAALVGLALLGASCSFHSTTEPKQEDNGGLEGAIKINTSNNGY